MTDKNKNWMPDDDEALKALIRTTIRNLGASDPSALPSKVREQIRARVSGDIDIDDYVKRVLAETRKD